MQDVSKGNNKLNRLTVFVMLVILITTISVILSSHLTLMSFHKTQNLSTANESSIQRLVLVNTTNTNNMHRKQTKEEANTYKTSQSTQSIDGEKALKKQTQNPNSSSIQYSTLVNTTTSTNKVHRKRTTEEANAYMASQPTQSVDGEKALKKQMKKLELLQPKMNSKHDHIRKKVSSQQTLYVSCKTTSRWLGYPGDEQELDVTYWLMNNATKEQEKMWLDNIERRNKVLREKDKIWYPSLFGDKQN